MARISGRKRLLILGAGGRDFHNFNMCYRSDPHVEVVAFTATQIPGIAGRRYPPELAGPLYPDGIPIRDECELESLCRELAVDQVVFAYSDVSHEEVMHLASRVLATGADFQLLGPAATQLRASIPVIAVSAVRTGCGKSQVTRYLSRLLRQAGYRVAVIRHPMPYGDLARQAVQRFACRADLAAAACTLEEREEYEPHLAVGNTVFAGVDYARILTWAQSEADILLWDGGNNDFPFLRPDWHVVLVDPLRAGHESRYHPGEAVLRMADVIIVAKCDAASPAAVNQLSAAAHALNAAASVIRVASPVRLEESVAVRGRRVLVIEDGPTLTHGGMPWGAGHVAATQAGAVIVDPRPFVAEAMQSVYERFPHLGPVLPALGYSAAQLEALRQTIGACPVEGVVSASPIDLAALVAPDKPVWRVSYELAELEEPGLAGQLMDFLARQRPR